MHFHHFWEFKGVKSYNYSKLQLSPPANRVSRSLLSLVASNSIKLVDNRSPESLRAFEILSVWLQHVEIVWEGFADSTLSHNFSFSNSDPESDNSDSSDSDFEPEKEVTGNDTWLQWFHFLSILAFFCFFFFLCVYV